MFTGKNKMFSHCEGETKNYVIISTSLILFSKITYNTIHAVKKFPASCHIMTLSKYYQFWDHAEGIWILKMFLLLSLS